jgi:hypothetical protein
MQNLMHNLMQNLMQRNAEPKAEADAEPRAPQNRSRTAREANAEPLNFLQPLGGRLLMIAIHDVREKCFDIMPCLSSCC